MAKECLERLAAAGRITEHRGELSKINGIRRPEPAIQGEAGIKLGLTVNIFPGLIKGANGRVDHRLNRGVGHRDMTEGNGVLSPLGARLSDRRRNG